MFIISRLPRVTMKTKHCYIRCLLLQTSTTKIKRQIVASLFTSRYSLNDKPASQFPVPEISSLPQDLQDRFGKLKVIPNFYRVLSYRPQELRAFLSYSDIVMKDKGNIKKVDKYMIALTIGVKNQCIYCATTYSALFRMFSKDHKLTEELLVDWKIAGLNSRQNAILEFAMEVCNSRTPSEEHYKKLYEHHLTLDDAWDIGTVAAFISLSNRIAQLTKMKPNLEYIKHK